MRPSLLAAVPLPVAVPVLALDGPCKFFVHVGKVRRWVPRTTAVTIPHSCRRWTMAVVLESDSESQARKSSKPRATVPRGPLKTRYLRRHQLRRRTRIVNATPSPRRIPSLCHWQWYLLYLWYYLV